MLLNNRADMSKSLLPLEQKESVFISHNNQMAKSRNQKIGTLFEEIGATKKYVRTAHDEVHTTSYLNQVHAVLKACSWVNNYIKIKGLVTRIPINSIPNKKKEALKTVWEQS